MSAPLYRVGQAVAVCAFELGSTNPTIVIPRTVVESISHFEAGTIYQWTDGYEFKPEKSMHLYKVEADASFLFDESRLRPLQDDDYLDRCTIGIQKRIGERA